MKSNLKVVFTVSMLLITLSIAISLINFAVALQSTKKELVDRSLPLSVDNIYSEIQNLIIEPSLISSIMAHDTFVRDWLLYDEKDQTKITQFLARIKNQYGMYVTFLVSENTHHYYTHNGFLEKITPDKADNQWYFRFRDSEENHEINLDTNSQLDNSLFMFMNYKIFDENYQLIGATGIGHKIQYVDEMLKRFRQQFRFRVYFVDSDGKIVLSEALQKKPEDLSAHPVLGKMKDQLISPDSQVIEYQHQQQDYLIKTKFIPELNMYLLVEAKIDDFTESVENTFYFNLTASLFITVIVTLLVLLTIRGYNKKLEFFATKDTLTELMNRREFEESFHKLHALSKRNKAPLTLLFFDIDNFKEINDSYGHHIGDKVLKRVAELMRQQLREADLYARWGGEEFVVAMINTDTEATRQVAEKLRMSFEQDAELERMVKMQVTASFGIHGCKAEESLDNAIIRADKAMYQAKQNGKNQVCVA